MSEATRPKEWPWATRLEKMPASATGLFIGDTMINARAEANAEGDSRGCMKCPECGDSRFWKPFHEISYKQGNQTMGIGWLCAECWQKLPIERKLEHQKKLRDIHISNIPSVLPITGPEGGFIDCPIDTERYRHELEQVNSFHEAIGKVVS